MEFSFAVGLWVGNCYMPRKIESCAAGICTGENSIFYKNDDIIAKKTWRRKHNLTGGKKSPALPPLRMLFYDSSKDTWFEQELPPPHRANTEFHVSF